jgi:hypothetical protein
MNSLLPNAWFLFGYMWRLTIATRCTQRLRSLKATQWSCAPRRGFFSFYVRFGDYDSTRVAIFIFWQSSAHQTLVAYPLSRLRSIEITAFCNASDAHVGRRHTHMFLRAMSISHRQILTIVYSLCAFGNILRLLYDWPGIFFYHASPKASQAR